VSEIVVSPVIISIMDIITRARVELPLRRTKKQEDVTSGLPSARRYSAPRSAASPLKVYIASVAEGKKHFWDVALCSLVGVD